MKSLKIDRSGYKVGVAEIEGLEAAMREVLEPVREYIADKAYWNSDIKAEMTEYKSRDGFIPYSHNCGGLELSLIVPNCEVLGWPYLESVECDLCEGEGSQCGYEGMECGAEGDGYLDSKFRVWLKLEGVEELEQNGKPVGQLLKFYLYCGGGNGDAPYFRTAHESTFFETEFVTADLDGFKRKAKAAIKKMMSDWE